MRQGSEGREGEGNDKMRYAWKSREKQKKDWKVGRFSGMWQI